MTRVSLGLAVPLVALVARPAAGNAQPGAIDRASLARLSASSVVVYWPDHLPARLGPIRSVQIVDVGSDGYYVAFSPVAACAGATSCSFFHISGYRSTGARSAQSRSTPGDRSVALPAGQTGIYRPPDCSGATCTEASLTFVRGAATYELDAKVDRDPLGVLRDAYRHLRRVVIHPRRDTRNHVGSMTSKRT
jgi:hypothetical protein